MKESDANKKANGSPPEAPHFARKRWQERFVVDAAETEVLSKEQEDALWQKLEASLTFSDQTPEKKTGASPYLWAVGFLAAACILFFFPWQQQQPQTGVKSATSDTYVKPRLHGFRFAVVQADGKLVPGEQNMDIPVGTPIVFSLESKGLKDSIEPYQATITYQKLPFASETEITTIQVTDEHMTVKGKDGFVAFTPQEPGNYMIRAFEQTAEGKKHDLSIGIRAVPTR